MAGWLILIIVVTVTVVAAYIQEQRTGKPNTIIKNVTIVILLLEVLLILGR